MSQMQTSKVKLGISTKSLSKIAILGAMAAMLMYFEFPLPFAPSFMGIDFSDIPVLLASYALGPISAILTATVKIVIKLLLKPTATFFIGEFSNLILTIIYVSVAGIYYQKHRHFKGAVISLILATVTVSIFAFLSNGFIVYPLYAAVLGQNIHDLIMLTKSINGLVVDYWTMMLFMVVPFNLIKYAMVSLITGFIYKYVSPLIKN